MRINEPNNPIDLTDAFAEDAAETERVLGRTEPYPDLRKELPWDQPPAPDATRPVSRQSHEVAPDEAQALWGQSPADVRRDAQRRAISGAKSALRIWEEALDWVAIDDPALPGDYDAVGKAMDDFIARLTARQERS